MSILHDLLFSLRSLRKTPEFSLVVIVTMALGIGANAAVFSLVHLMLLRPLPYPDPSHLLKLYEAKTPNSYSTHAEVAPGNFLDWQKQTLAFADMAAFCGFDYNLTGNGLPEHAQGGAISADWFKVLGVHADWVVTSGLKKTRPAPHRSSSSVTNSGNTGTTRIQRSLGSPLV